MGVIYSIACRECKVVRDLDKFYGARSIETRADALEYSKELGESEGWLFRSALLVSFMSEHQGHDCVFFNEHDSVSDDLDPYYDDNEYKEDTDFWKK